jgi:hypothetical protein
MRLSDTAGVDVGGASSEIPAPLYSQLNLLHTQRQQENGNLPRLIFNRPTMLTAMISSTRYSTDNPHHLSAHGLKALSLTQ